MWEWFRNWRLVDNYLVETQLLRVQHVEFCRLVNCCVACVLQQGIRGRAGAWREEDEGAGVASVRRSTHLQKRKFFRACTSALDVFALRLRPIALDALFRVDLGLHVLHPLVEIFDQNRVMLVHSRYFVGPSSSEVGHGSF